jgi:hypothetical protein
MRNIILILLLATVSLGAAAQWREVGSGANSTSYVDPDTIRRSGDRTAMAVLIDFQKPPFDGNNLPYLSLTMQNEYDCAHTQFRVLAIVSHAANMGHGEQLYRTDEPSDWEPVASGTVQKDLWKAACAGERRSK